MACQPELGNSGGGGNWSATRSISIRVPIADLEQARQIAEKTGVGYQTVLKQAIREGLKRAR
jgi:predicted DNA binding CopG/RHH family protein